MKFKYIIFDLDGTLLDTGRGIKNGIQHTLAYLGQPIPTWSELNKFIGPPLHESFRTFCHLCSEKIDDAVTFYRSYYKEYCLFQNDVYPGIPELLQKLRQQDLTLAVATSKLESFAIRMLEHCGLAPFFSFIAGSNLDGSCSTKEQVLNHVLENCNISDLTQAILLGDRMYDIIGAKATGIASAGILHGYGSKEELMNAGADYIFENAERAGTFLLA